MTEKSVKRRQRSQTAETKKGGPRGLRKGTIDAVGEDFTGGQEKKKGFRDRQDKTLFGKKGKTSIVGERRGEHGKGQVPRKKTD